MLSILYLKHSIESFISNIPKTIKSNRCWTLQFARSINCATKRLTDFQAFYRLYLPTNLPNKNRAESDLTNTRTPKNHFPKIIHQIACRENINSRKVILPTVTTIRNINSMELRTQKNTFEEDPYLYLHTYIEVYGNIHTTPAGSSWFPWMVNTGKPTLKCGSS